MHEPSPPRPGPPSSSAGGWAAPPPPATADDPAGGQRAPGAAEAPTGHPGVDAQLELLTQADHLDVAEHLPLYEEVHRALRDTLTELDRPPGPPPPARPGQPSAVSPVAPPTPTPTPRS